MKKLTHVDDQSRPRMVDVTDKPVSYRVARAQGHIDLQGDTVTLIKQHGIKKGNVLTVAELAGVQAAKQTPQLIPLCHTLLLSSVQVDAALVTDVAYIGLDVGRVNRDVSTTSTSVLFVSRYFLEAELEG